MDDFKKTATFEALLNKRSKITELLLTPGSLPRDPEFLPRPRLQTPDSRPLQISTLHQKPGRCQRYRVPTHSGAIVLAQCLVCNVDATVHGNEMLVFVLCCRCVDTGTGGRGRALA